MIKATQSEIELSATQWGMMQTFKNFKTLPCTSINMNTAKSLIRKGLCQFDHTDAAIILTTKGIEYNKIN